MRCMYCGTEMTLISAVADETMMVSGYQHQTYMCPSCADVEKRFVFRKHDEQPEHGAAPALTPPPVASPPNQNQAAAEAGLLQRVISKIRKP
jgi:hypothetical protein